MNAYDILKIGGTIEFPWGYRLTGDVVSGYIDTTIILAGDEHPDGIRPLDKDGTRLAIKDAYEHKRLSEQSNT